MKIRLPLVTGLLYIFFQLPAMAQGPVLPREPDYNKPELFADLPDRLNLRVADLEPLFALPAGSRVDVRVADRFPFQGTVVSKSPAGQPSVQSVVIRSTNRGGAALTFTRVTLENGSHRYQGRILSLANGDAFEIIQVNGVYVLQKRKLHDLINE